MKKQEIFDTIEGYYDVDLDNCTMTHEDWIKQIVEALTDDKYLEKMIVLFHEYGGVMSNETKDWRETDGEQWVTLFSWSK